MWGLHTGFFCDTIHSCRDRDIDKIFVFLRLVTFRLIGVLEFSHFASNSLRLNKPRKCRLEKKPPSESPTRYLYLQTVLMCSSASIYRGRVSVIFLLRVHEPLWSFQCAVDLGHSRLEQARAPVLHFSQ